MPRWNKDIIRDEIRSLMETINEQWETIGQYRDRIPQIEFDIFRENIRKLYENLYLLDKSEDTPAEVLKKESPAPAPPHTEIHEQGILFTVQKEVPPEVEPPVELPENKPVSTESPKHPQRERRQPGMPDLFSVAGDDFSAKLRETRERSVGQTLRHTPEDLKSLITINDKFLFINELFDGNLREYNAAVDELEAAGERTAAFAILDRLRITNRWDSDSAAFHKLAEILGKRFYL
jgi:hypothetical protein